VPQATTASASASAFKQYVYRFIVRGVPDEADNCVDTRASAAAGREVYFTYVFHRLLPEDHTFLLRRIRERFAITSAWVQALQGMEALGVVFTVMGGSGNRSVSISPENFTWGPFRYPM
jgi:hypothetical protein